MPFYKSPDNKVHFLDSDNFSHLLPVGSILIEETEAKQLTAPPAPTSEELASAARTKRDGLLSACDWTVLADAPLTTAQKTTWKTYRQALRDITNQVEFPVTIDWPVAP